MPILRLKSYAATIYKHYLNLADEPTESEENTTLGKKIRNSYSMTTQTVLFFNQPVEEMDLESWCNEVPISYQLKIDDFISKLEDSTRWAISAIDMREEEPAMLKVRLLYDIDKLRIKLLDEYENDSITAQFEKTCNLLHTDLPDNLRKRKALIRLVWAYLEAKELTAMARELSSCNRIDYLKKLTKY